MSDPVFFRNLLAVGVSQYERDQCIRGELGSALIPLGVYDLTQDLKHQTGAVSGLGGIWKGGGYEFNIYRAHDHYVIEIWKSPNGIQVFTDPSEPRLPAMPPDLAIRLNSLPGAHQFIRADEYARGLDNEEIQDREGVRRWHVNSMEGLCVWARFILDNVGLDNRD